MRLDANSAHCQHAVKLKAIGPINPLSKLILVAELATIMLSFGCAETPPPQLDGIEFNVNLPDKMVWTRRKICILNGPVMAENRPFRILES